MNPNPSTPNEYSANLDIGFLVLEYSLVFSLILSTVIGLMSAEPMKPITPTMKQGRVLLMIIGESAPS